MTSVRQAIRQMLVLLKYEKTQLQYDVKLRNEGISSDINADAEISQKFAYLIKLILKFIKVQTSYKAVAQDAQESCRDFHPMLQLYCMFYTTYTF